VKRFLAVCWGEAAGRGDRSKICQTRRIPAGVVQDLMFESKGRGQERSRKFRSDRRCDVGLEIRLVEEESGEDAKS